MERTFEIAAVGEYPSAVSWSNFLLPDSVLAKITGADISDICVIRLEEGIGQTGRQEAYTNLENLATVSYTHLDVYKRQLLESQAARTIVTNHMNNDLTITNDSLRKEDPEDHRDVLTASFMEDLEHLDGVSAVYPLLYGQITVPVSYTHLVE